ncbi:transposase [Fimbriimonas ginsengisoli]|uniref:transposase n=1 Tax=Fimbriimonas ginsengisoli TaxID=1005039 RepID=UPI00130D5777|nr:transposase [Fimbriimonas ginsengisoli]
MQQPIRAKKHRLPEAAYIGEKTVHITANVEHRRPLFTDPAVVQAFLEILRACSAAERCLVPICCFMPDHLHLLMQGTSANSRPKAATDAFKGRSGHWLLQNRPNWNWQESYYDTNRSARRRLEAEGVLHFSKPHEAGNRGRSVRISFHREHRIRPCRDVARDFVVTDMASPGGTRRRRLHGFAVRHT